MKPFEINLHFSEWRVKRIILRLIYKETEVRTSMLSTIMEIIYRTKKTNCLALLEKEPVEANGKKRIKFSLQILNS